MDVDTITAASALLLPFGGGILLEGEDGPSVRYRSTSLLAQTILLAVHC
jgi:hypothetical protein